MTMNLSPSESPTTGCCLVLAKGRLIPELWPAPCTSQMGDTSCRIMRTACVSRMSTHLLKSLQGLGQIWTEVWITYSGSNVFPRVPAPSKSSNRTVASSWRYVGSHSSTTGMQAQWSRTDAPQQGSTAEHQHFWAGSIDRTQNTLCREGRDGMKEPKVLLFSSHWKQAEQSLCTIHSRVPASLPCKNQQKA